MRPAQGDSFSSKLYCQALFMGPLVPSICVICCIF